MLKASNTYRPARNRIRLAALSLVAVAATGLGVSQLTDAAEPEHEARMSAIPTPCDDFADCIYTAAWYAFWR